MTTKHGTTPQVNGSYVEFQAAVLRALPRDINPDVALGWTQNGESLARALRGALTPDDKSAANAYPISIDYKRSVKEGVKAGRYDYVDSDITPKNFPTNRKGKAKVVIELIHLDWVVLTDEALREIDKMGYCPAELREILAFGEKYPKVQREFPVVALGSVWRDRRGNRDIPYLDGNDSERLLALNWLGFVWYEICRFAAVRK